MPTFSALHWLFVDGIVGESKSVGKEKDTLGALFGTIHAAEQKGGEGKREGGRELFDSKIFKPSPAAFQLLSFRQAFILSTPSQIFTDDESARPPGLDADCYSSQNGEHSDASWSSVLTQF
ncbi:hypothetical protein T03_13869 [Trichinella britovi]|uniref:Uncharacterized protein n=1 Tax=Trichinella britovi TaxID=45882 RepID=A0A0V1CMF3_TRIBR|nr:hypothetical protein T03_13869 [Trichinella britovi]